MARPRVLSFFLPIISLVSAIPTKFASIRAAEVQCPIVLDGRVPTNTTLTSLDSTNNLFSPDYVKGANLSWSDILLFPNTTTSKFDAGGYKSIEVTISDKSIFNGQTGFRRAGLQFAADSSDDTSDQGIKTIHFSVMQDPARPMNLSHEYLNVWHETSDYSANQFNFEAGTIIGSSGGDKANFKVLGRNNNIIYSVPISSGNWQNFAITLDYNANTLKVYYSQGADELQAVTDAVSNDNSGAGQFQIGMLKKPTGTSDVVYSGYQESGIDEGQIYGGLFVEDSANGCVST